jgi:protein-tyrosine-phosphatase
MSSRVLFICEHGSAKSVVAAAHFNKLAEERGLDVRAVSRGTDPDEVNNPVAIAGLSSDHLSASGVPTKLSRTDLVTAKRVIGFSELPAEYSGIVSADVWTVPAVSEGYDIARDEIVRRIEGLLSGME